MGEKANKGYEREKELGAVHDFRVIPMSGSGWMAKGDLYDARFGIQVKSTFKKAITVTIAILLGTLRDARQSHKFPLLFLDYPRSDALKVLDAQTWVAFPLDRADEFVELWQARRAELHEGGDSMRPG